MALVKSNLKLACIWSACQEVLKSHDSMFVVGSESSCCLQSSNVWSVHWRCRFLNDHVLGHTYVSYYNSRCCSFSLYELLRCTACVRDMHRSNLVVQFRCFAFEWALEVRSEMLGNVTMLLHHAPVIESLKVHNFIIRLLIQFKAIQVLDMLFVGLKFWCICNALYNVYMIVPPGSEHIRLENFVKEGLGRLEPNMMR